MFHVCAKLIVLQIVEIRMYQLLTYKILPPKYLCTHTYITHTNNLTYLTATVLSLQTQNCRHNCRHNIAVSADKIKTFFGDLLLYKSPWRQ